MSPENTGPPCETGRITLVKNNYNSTYFFYDITVLGTVGCQVSLPCTADVVWLGGEGRVHRSIILRQTHLHLRPSRLRSHWARLPICPHCSYTGREMGSGWDLRPVPFSHYWAVPKWTEPINGRICPSSVLSCTSIRYRVSLSFSFSILSINVILVPSPPLGPNL